MTKVDKKWKMLTEKSQKEILGLPQWLLSILANRGQKTEQQISSFLDPKYEELLNPIGFTSMSKTTERIALALSNQEKVVIYGDYDVDGVTSTALMFEVLKKIGIKNVETYIPHREDEGYGLNKEAVEEIIKNGTKLIISVDCGVTSQDLIDNFSEKVDFIVIDHHEIDPKKIPQRALILHPRLVEKGIPSQNLSACGMAFFLAKNIASSKKFGISMGWEKWLLDLVALSTICDIVPLVGQNRILAKFGLKVLSKTKRIGIEALANVSSVNLANISAYDVGFLLGPRINASGRMEHARKALDLLLTDSKVEAMKISSGLNKLNTERQQLCGKILDEAKAEIESSGKKDHEIYLLSNKNWPKGVVGIIASKISDLYSRPVIVFEHDDKEHHGSARSIEALDITEALSEVEEHLIKFGGHSRAAGLSVSDEKWVIFGDKLLEIVRGKIKQEDLAPIIKIDTEIEPADIGEKTIDMIEKLEPFGFGNPTPVFVMYDVAVENVTRVGSGKEHLKFKINDFQAISFSDKTPLKDGDKINIAFTLRYNVWNERKSIEIRAVDIKQK